MKTDDANTKVSNNGKILNTNVSNGKILNTNVSNGKILNTNVSNSKILTPTTYFEMLQNNMDTNSLRDRQASKKNWRRIS